MASMRYVRASGGNIQENTRGYGSNKWVLPGRTSSSILAVRGGRGRGVGGGLSGGGRGRFSGGRFSHSFVRGSSKGGGGDRLFPVGRGNKWVRDSCQGDIEQSKDAKAENSANAIAKTEADAPTASDTYENDKAVDAPTRSLERRGKHKLVMETNSFNIAPERAATQTQVDRTNAMSQAFKSGSNSWKRGSSDVLAEKKIINSSGIAPKKAAAQTEIDGSNARSQAVKSGNNSWKRQSSEIFSENKITYSSKIASERAVAQTEIDVSNARSQLVKSGNNSWKRQSSELWPEKKSRQNPRHAGNHGKGIRADPSTGPHRISLLKPATSETDRNPSAKKEGIVSAASLSANKELPSSEKTLTDFCYQNTGRGSSGGRESGWGRGRGQLSIRCVRANGGGSMGLVRVRPHNPSSTPVCPTFRRGLLCNNPRCTLRHDVATEALRPICVFFQRNGMCSKDDCPFRHVKVRWDVEICPVFERMGYCEDPHCLLRHVVAKKPRIKKFAA